MISQGGRENSCWPDNSDFWNTSANNRQMFVVDRMEIYVEEFHVKGVAQLATNFYPRLQLLQCVCNLTSYNLTNPNSTATSIHPKSCLSLPSQEPPSTQWMLWGSQKVTGLKAWLPSRNLYHLHHWRNETRKNWALVSRRAGKRQRWKTLFKFARFSVK